jgi:hypothetical protein
MCVCVNVWCVCECVVCRSVFVACATLYCEEDFGTCVYVCVCVNVCVCVDPSSSPALLLIVKRISAPVVCVCVSECYYVVCEYVVRECAFLL